MTPKLTIRSFTNDQYILDKVFYSNFYRLRGFQEGQKRPVVLDLGAHCGYFTFAALSLGAKKVYAFEPFTPNYKMLLTNVGDNPIGPVIPYQLGVYVAPVCLTFKYPELSKNSFFDFSTIGMDANAGNPEHCKCCMITLDTILKHYVEEPIDIMKISIGYAETAILESSELFGKNVSSVCGEIITDDTGVTKLKSVLLEKGFLYLDISPVVGEEGRSLFLASKTNIKESFL